MTSSPVTYPADAALASRDGASRDVVVRRYRTEDSAEAITLERACPQGRALQLSFRRDTFHRRAESYPRHAIFTAVDEGRIVGVMAVAVKDASLHGRSVRASFGFDLRVHPAYRQRGVATRLFEHANGWGLSQAEVGYSYAMADNRVVRGIASRYGSEAARYAYLVYPVLARRPPTGGPTPTSVEEVHREVLRRCGPFDFICDPLRDGPMPGHQGSWLLRRGAALAGCSAWSSAGILSEVVERLPWTARVARALSRTPPLDRLAWPRLPRPGDELRSWYLFDFFATDGEVARDLTRSVAAEARARGIDWCHVIHTARDGWMPWVRADVPRPFAPVISYLLLMLRADAKPPRPVDRLYVDVRDV